MTSSFRMPAQRADSPWVFPWQPPVNRTCRMTSPSSSMSICAEQTASQVRNDALRMPSRVLSVIFPTSNMAYFVNLFPSPQAFPMTSPRAR